MAFQSRRQSQASTAERLKCATRRTKAERIVCAFRWRCKFFFAIPQRTFDAFENFHTLPNAFSAHSKIFTACPAYFWLVRKNLRVAQRNFGSFGKIYEPPNALLTRSKTFTLCPAYFQLMQKFYFLLIAYTKSKNLLG